MKSFANALLHSSAAAGLRRTHNRAPFRRKQIDDADTERQLGSNNGEVDRSRFATSRSARGGDVGRNASRVSGVSGVTWGADHVRHSALAGKFPGDRVFARAVADHEDLHRCEVIPCRTRV